MKELRIIDRLLVIITLVLISKRGAVKIKELTDERFQHDPDPIFDIWMSRALGSFRPKGRRRSSGSLYVEPNIHRLLWGSSRSELHTRSMPTSQLDGVANVNTGDQVDLERCPGVDVVFFDQIEPHILDRHPYKQHLDAEGLWNDAISDNPDWKGIVVADKQLNGPTIVQGVDGAHRLTLARRKFYNDHGDKSRDVAIMGRRPSRLFRRILRENKIYIVRTKNEDGFASTVLERVSARKGAELKVQLVENEDYATFVLAWRRGISIPSFKILKKDAVDIDELVSLRTFP